MPSCHERRLSLFRELLATQSFDTLMVLVGENRRYLSGYTGDDGQFDETAGVLLISWEKAILVTDSRYDLQAAREAPLCEVIRYTQGLFKELPAILSSMGTRRLGFESVRLTVSQHEQLSRELQKQTPDITLVPAQDVVEPLRMLKDSEEIATIKKALSLTESVFQEFLSAIRVGISEKSLAWGLEQRLREAGADALSFPTIVAFGPNSALPHAVPTDRTLQKGEPVLFDFGVRLDGYCSDISRTVIVGKPDETYRKVYQTVLEAQERAIAMIAPGVSSKAVDAAARDHITQMGYGDFFGHGLGHGVGLAIHEAPRVSPTKDIPLTPGMVFTVEPGIYLPDWGGVRLENMVLVTETGVEVLNTTSPSPMMVLAES